MSVLFLSNARQVTKIYSNTTGINKETIDITFRVKKLDEELKMVSELCMSGVEG
jgi:hypothetical protein